MSRATLNDHDERLLILAPVGRDGDLLRQTLWANGVPAFVCPDVETFGAEFERGAGAAILTEEALYLSSSRALAAVVGNQPQWSDFPFVVLTNRGDADAQLRTTLELMRPLHNVTVIERPVRPATILTAIDAALRDRRRQYAVRDTLDELRQSREALRSSEERYRTLAEAVPHLVWSCHANGECDYLSTQWLAYTGVPLEDQLGYGWLNAVHPDDRETAERAWRDAVEERASYDLDYRLRSADGDYRWFRTRGKPQRGERGEIVKWYGTCTDVHDRKLAEEALELANRVSVSLAADLDVERIVRALTDASTQATGAHFGAFFYNVTNDAGESYMLYTISGVPREEFSKFPMPRNTPVFGPTFSGEGIVRSDDITQDPRYGTMDPHRGMPEGHLPVRSYLAIPVVSRSGEVIGGLFFGHSERGRFSEAHERIVSSFGSQAAVAMDNARLYSKLKELNAGLERRVEERTESLQAAIRELEGFTYSISHDMRAPLRSMVGNARMLLTDYGAEVPPEGRDHLERIAAAASKMAALVDDLLQFARLGNQEVRRQPVDISELAESIAESVYRDEECEARVKVEPDLHVTADRELLRMVLHNLFHNSCKYRARDRGAEVEFGALPRDGKTVFFVRDNGIGFDPKYAPKLFKPFERLHRDAAYPGTGIGLANVKRIIERHGGEVWAEGHLDQGSTFYFTLE